MPYDGVQHAGGKVYNYYLKKISQHAEVTLIAGALAGEAEKSTVEKYGIRPYYISFDEVKNLYIKKVFSFNSKINPFHKYGHITTRYRAKEILKKVYELKNQGYQPDVIELDWTQTILLIDEIKKIYPNIKIVVGEVDVTYLRLFREISGSRGIKKIYRKLVYINEKKRELVALGKSNIIYVNNIKDKLLLINDGVDEKKIHIQVPYFYKCQQTRKEIESKDLLFFGDMSRPENKNACIWFIENVLNEINIKDVRFIILGGKSEELKKYSSDKIIVTGYVDDIEPYFMESAIFVAPLFYGAGIKIKVLEALYSGIPVIASEVAIEGIPAADGHDFYFFSGKNDIKNIIEHILNNYDEAKIVGKNGKNTIINNFDYEKSVTSYVNDLLLL